MLTKLILLILLLYSATFSAPKVTVINSTPEHLKLHISINSLTIDELKPIHVLVGLPNNKYPELQIQMLNKESLINISGKIGAASIKWTQIQKLRGLWVGTLQINPGTDGITNNQYFSEISISVNFDNQPLINNSKMNVRIPYDQQLLELHQQHLLSKHVLVPILA